MDFILRRNYCIFGHYPYNHLSLTGYKGIFTVSFVNCERNITNIQSFHFFISTLVTNFSGSDHQYVSNLLIILCNGTFFFIIFIRKYTYKISSKIPRSSRGMPIFSSFLVRNLKPRKTLSIILTDVSQSILAQ